MKKIYSTKKWLLCLSTLFVSAAAANAQVTLEEWSFATSAAPTTVGTGVVGTTPTLSHLFTSTYTNNDPDTPGAYSAYYGEAISANDGAGTGVAGDGGWSHTAPSDGPGSKLYIADQNGIYQQFVLTADASHSLSVDAITFNAGFLNTNSGTALAIQYSHSAFVSDSDTVCSAGTSFADSLLLPKESGATVPAPLVSFTVSTSCAPITVAPGHSVSFRIYFGCGTSSLDRFALFQDFAFVGTSTTESVATIQQRAAISIYPNPATDNITVTGTEQNDIISITNVLGKEVARYNCNGGSESIATSSLSPALYIVRVLSADGNQVSVQKLTKN